MEIKEAIEFLENRHKYRLHRGSVFDISEMNEAIDIIINIAKQGEKYRQMWEDIKEYVYNDEGRSLLIHVGDTKKIMKVMEQKYFPKEVKQDYPEGDE